VHFNDLLNGTYNLQNYDILNFPGGFSFGDDIASGKVMSNKIKYKTMQNGRTFIEEIDLFLKNGNYILGVCNGYQILVQLGLLPDIKEDYTPETSLEKNDSGKYEDRWVYCKVNQKVNSPFLNGIDLIALPVRHGEGKLVINDSKTQNSIIEHQLIALQYATANGEITKEYPLNPNGADLNIAGLVNKTGQILGLMPHPEAFLSFYNHPDWSNLQKNGQEINRENTGQKLFDNIVQFIENKK
jgi:phosphoribosylformylglycinamidine synthase